MLTLEIALLTEASTRTAKVVAVTNCELYFLSTSIFYKALAENSKMYDLVKEVAYKRALDDKIRKVVEVVPLFQGASKGILTRIISSLKLIYYYHNDIVIKKDDLGDGMFFIAYGTLQVI